MSFRAISRRDFLKYTTGTVACVSFGQFTFGCASSNTAPLATSYPIASDVFTTRQRAIVPGTPPRPGSIKPWEVAKYEANGYGTWQYVPGIDSGKQTFIMPAGYDAAASSNSAELLNFFTITDMHTSDKESPSQSIYLSIKDYPKVPFYPAMLYTTHVLDAVIQTVNALHIQKTFDCGLSLGDVCQNSQFNELRWYLDVIDGKVVTPSSGAHAGADSIDYQKTYKAAGIDKSIPWYQTLGSHDYLWFGALKVSDALRQNYIGEDILQISDPFSPVDHSMYYMGVIDGSTPHGTIIGAGPVGSTPPVKVAADPDRRSFANSKKTWMSEFLNTSSYPVGHGFTQINIDNGFACYSFEPKANIPIKIIMLDDTQTSEDPLPNDLGNGYLDQTRYDWLVEELDRGQAEGKLMIIGSHVPIGVMASGTGSWSPNQGSSDVALIAKLQSYPNFILWLAGHRHGNQISPFVSPDPGRPELGFWEVETSSIKDFPQQFRTFQIVRNSDNTVSIITTNVDPAVAEGSPAAVSRSYAVAAQQFYPMPAQSHTLLAPMPILLPSSPTLSYNAELLIQLSPEMKVKIKNLGTPVLT